MKTSYKYFSLINQNVLIGLSILITLFGLSIKAHGQSPEIGNDFDRFTNSMKLHLNETELSVLIPKVNKEELSDYTDISNDQLVYVKNEIKGFHIYQDGQWNKVSVATVIEKVSGNIQVLAPTLDSIIISTSLASNEKFLDYNTHVRVINSLFDLGERQGNYAIQLKSDK